jgi:hypothetical protein
VVHEPLSFAGVELVDAAGIRSDDGELPRCNRSSGHYVISPRTRPMLAIQLSRAADVSWTLFTDESGQPALRGSSLGRQRIESALDELAQLAGGRPYEGRLRLVAREDAYVVHGPGSVRGIAETEIAFRYEDTEPRFVAQWGDEGGLRELAREATLFTRSAHAEVVVTREEAVPMKIEVSWWPEAHPEDARTATTGDLRSLQTQQAQLAFALDEDGPYVLRLRSFRYDTRASETVEAPDVELTCRLVLDRDPPSLSIAGLEAGSIVRADADLPEELELRLDALPGREEPHVDLHWSLYCSSASPWSSSGSLTVARDVARLPIASIHAENGSVDGRFTLELSGEDAAGNALAPASLDFEIAMRGPEVELEEPGAVGKWYPDATSGRWSVRLRARDANGVGDDLTCALRVAGEEPLVPIELTDQTGGSGEERVFEGAVSLPHSLSERSVTLEVTAHDRRGARSVWTSDPLELPSIARPRPERVGIRFHGRGVEPMRLVRGNAGYPYVFGGRGDAIENAAFVRAGLPAFNQSPRRSRPRSWQIEYAAGAIADFYLDEREVRVGQFLAFVEDPDGYAAARHWPDAVPDPARREELSATLARAPADRPVADVTWHEAAAYARWAGKRLPSWVEWELAVRAGGLYRVSAHDAMRAAAVDSHRGNGVAELCASVSEWTCTPAAFENEEERRNPHLWARARPELLVQHASSAPAFDCWIAGASSSDERFDFSVADHRPRSFRDHTVGFRCAASLEEVQMRLGAAPGAGPVFEELP